MALPVSVRRGLLATGGLLLLTPVVLMATWPSLLEGTARDKLQGKLKSKFDVVELGDVELEKTNLKIHDIHLEKNSIIIDLEDITVDFDIMWGFDPQLIITQAVARDGTFIGDLDDVIELKKSTSSGSSGGTPTGRVQLEEAELELENFEILVRRGSQELKAQVNATAPNPKGPIDVELSSLELLEDEVTQASAGTLTTSLNLENIFPLDVLITDAEAHHEDVAIKDVEGTLSLEDEGITQVSMDLHGRTEVGQSWTLKGSVDRTKKEVDVILSAQGIQPSQLPGAHQLPLNPDVGVVSGTVSLKGSRKKVRLEAEVEVKGLQLEHRKLSREPVLINNRFEAVGLVDLEARRLVLEKGAVSSLENQSWELVVSGEAHHAVILEERKYEFQVKLESATCQELLEAAPPGLLPALENFELSGNTSVDLNVVMDMSDPDATVLEGGLDIDSCSIEEVPLTVANLSGPFSHRVRMKSGQTVSRLLGRGALYFTPYDRIPPSLPAAVLSTEDGGFWRHDGFIKSQFKASLKRNIELGTLRRGGSTITMQMVKNVLLTQEKTLSRKLQELFLTWVVEEQLTKQRIMEIYLNVVEFGPGIYGVGDAADHYFNKAPLELTSLESAFLATLLPRPVERHEMWCRGELTPKHEKYIHQVHRRMLARGRISQVEFDEAEGLPFEFSRQGWTGEGACLAAGRRVKDGKHTQGALSGLLLGRPD